MKLFVIFVFVIFNLTFFFFILQLEAVCGVRLQFHLITSSSLP